MQAGKLGQGDRADNYPDYPYDNANKPHNRGGLGVKIHAYKRTGLTARNGNRTKVPTSLPFMPT